MSSSSGTAKDLYLQTYIHERTHTYMGQESLTREVVCTWMCTLAHMNTYVHTHSHVYVHTIPGVNEGDDVFVLLARHC